MDAEYSPLMYPPGSVGGEVIESGGAGEMEIWNCCVTVSGISALSVIVTVKSTGPGWLLVGPEGVPVITPCTLRLSPAGSVFAGTV